MTQREQWEETSFQVFTGMDGVLRSGYYPTGEGLVSGNVAVDYVWGNFPLQPDDDRTDETITPANLENVGWTVGSKYVSDTLRTADYSVTRNNLTVKVPADSHTIATTGYSNYPAFIPNYAGDGDTALEVEVPNLVRKSLTNAQIALDPLDLDLFPNAHVLTVSALKTTGTTVKVTAYDTDYADWGNGYPNSALIGLRVGDQVSGALTVDGDPFNFTDVTVTKVVVDGAASYFEFVQAVATSPAIDDVATGDIIAGENLVGIVTLQRRLIVNEGQQVNVRYFND